uniref:Pre-mRNA splicing Prp18-interacting factor n=1 Tax=Tanacetum cinerariifolium TaxID=118510 RepID=A0A6L2JAP8_TANCI|nr:hypothetical protein [Tanacetum cinerariifolium]
MTSFDYRLNPLYSIKECSSCGALYTTDYCCSVGILENKIICDLDKTPDLSQRSPQNCPKCGNPVYGHYCQGCALLREKFKEDLFASCVENEILHDSSGPSNDNSNVANALRDPFVVNLDPGNNSSQVLHKSVPIIPDPEPFNNQTIKELPPTVQSSDLKFDLVHNSPNVFSPSLQPSIYSYEFCGNDAYYGQDGSLQLANLGTYPLKRFNSFCYDDDKDYTVAVTPSLSTEEPDNSLNQFKDFSDSNDEFSSTDDDSFSIDNIDYVEASPPDSELVSSEVMEIVISEVGGIDDDIILTIKDDILREQLLNINLLIAKIEALNDNPTPSSDFMTKASFTSLNSLLEKTNSFDNSLPEFETFCFDVEEISSGSATTRCDISLPEYEAFYDDHIKEISSGSTTTHSDSSLYDSFIFDLSINPFSPVDRSDFYKFVDELIHIISPPEYDCFFFKIEPNSGNFTMDVVEDISLIREPRVHNALPTHPTLQLDLEFKLSSGSFFTYIVWIFLPFLLYSVAPRYLLSLGNEATIFDPGIYSYPMSSF